MSKKIDTSQAAHGQPLTAPTGLDHLQTSYAEGFAQTIIALVGASYDDSKIYKLWGAEYSISIGGQLTNTAGAVFFNGEIFLVDAVPTGGVTISYNVNMALSTSFADPSGTTFEDGTVATILQIRKMTYVNNVTANLPIHIQQFAQYIGSTSVNTLTVKLENNNYYRISALSGGITITINTDNPQAGSKTVIHVDADDSGNAITFAGGGTNYITGDQGADSSGDPFQITIEYAGSDTYFISIIH